MKRLSFNCNKIVVLLYVIFSGFYLTKLFISPIYLFFLLGSLIFLMKHLILLRLSCQYMPIIVIIIGYFSLTNILHGSSDVNILLNIILCYIYFFVVYNLSLKIDSNFIKKLSVLFIYISVFLLIIECIYRFSHPQDLQFYRDIGREDLLFYAYKNNSIMYMDSNFVGMFILALYFFTLYLYNKRLSFLLFILFILALLSLSRAVILTTILFTFLFVIRDTIYSYRSYLYALIILIIPPLFVFLKKNAAVDYSFSTKFQILDLTISYIKIAPLVQILFGVGFGNSREFLGIGAHNIFIVYLVESGIFGLMLTMIFWMILIKRSNYKIGIILYPFVFAGLSFAPTAIPYLYVMFAIILILETR